MSNGKDGHSKAPAAFQRFEDLTKRLLSVSKKEADAKAAERERSKGKSR